MYSKFKLQKLHLRQVKPALLGNKAVLINPLPQLRHLVKGVCEFLEQKGHPLPVSIYFALHLEQFIGCSETEDGFITGISGLMVCGHGVTFSAK